MDVWSYYTLAGDALREGVFSFVDGVEGSKRTRMLRGPPVLANCGRKMDIDVDSESRC